MLSNSNIEELKTKVLQLPQDQLKEFNEWYEDLGNKLWDKQIEKDIINGKLDTLADAAINDHRSGKSKKL